MIGLTFGAWKVVEVISTSYYLCRCRCGTRRKVRKSDLQEGRSRSCGCGKRNKRLPDHGGALNHLITQYRRHALRRGLAFAIPREQFAHLIKQPCYYCGAPPSNHKRTAVDREGFRYNGLDRTNAKEGYTIENVVPACFTCNHAKNRMSEEAFLRLVTRIYHYRAKRNHRE